MKELAKRINHQSEIPLHKQIEKVLREKIASGEFDHGKLFPNEVDLSNLFAVSRNTVRQAFNKLVNEGLLERKQGKGTTVNRNGMNITHLEKWHSFTDDMARQGIEIKNYQINFTKESNNEKLAQLFGVPSEKEISKLLRIKGSEDAPFVVFESCFHPRIGLSESDDFTQSLSELLEKKYAIIGVKSEEELQATIADKRIAELLQIAPGSPIFYRERMVYDAGMRIIEFNKCYYRHDQMKYKITINRSL